MENEAKSTVASSVGIGAWMARGLAAYIALIGAQAFIVSVVLGIPYSRMLFPLALLCVPALFFTPLMYLSRRGGGVITWMFITAIIVFFVSFALALDYTAYNLGYLSPGRARDLVPFIFFTIIPIAVSLYVILKLRLGARPTSTSG
jgi:hypothetical protein